MLTRKLDKAKDAFQHRDPDASPAAHGHGTSEDHRDGGGRYLKSSIYGGLDGIITTFAVVAGATGASLSAGIVLILGSANLIADGLAMAFGEFLSGKAEREFNAAERERETWEFENHPEGKKRAGGTLRRKRSFPERCRESRRGIRQKKDFMVEVMMVEELGLFEADDSPLGNAVATFLSFITLASSP